MYVSESTMPTTTERTRWTGGTEGASSRYFSSPQSAMTTLAFGVPLFVPCFSIALTTSMPSTTLPNTTCFPFSLEKESSRLVCEKNIGNKTKLLIKPGRRVKSGAHQSVEAVQMKNWDPLVLGPALAIDKIPTTEQWKHDELLQQV